MRKKLVIAADVDPTLARSLGSDDRFEIVIHPTETEDELIALVADAEILVTRAHNPVTRRVISAAPKLELIAQGTSGIDNIDVEAAAERRIAISHLPGENANAVAEFVVGSMIALTRTLPWYRQEMIEGRWDRSDCARRHELRHYRLGIVGLGRVGSRVALLASAFGMSVQAVDPYIPLDAFAMRSARKVDRLMELLATSDIVTLHVPLTEETRRMIGAAEIAQLSRGSFLINSSRGEVLDQGAALAALAEGHLAGLALDVFDKEPPRTTFPDDPRLILTPHVAGCSFEAKAAIGAKLYEKIVAFCDGKS